MMKKETYENIFEKLKKSEGNNAIVFFTGIFVFLTAVIYLFTVFAVFCTGSHGIGFYSPEGDIKKINLVLVPLVGFTGVSIFRKIYNAPRPYEVYGFTPLYHKYMDPEKRKKGQSFPSRHVYSGFACGMAVLSVYRTAGIFILIMSAWLALFRVLMGVHFPKDVICGALTGVLLGIIGNFILPACL